MFILNVNLFFIMIIIINLQCFTIIIIHFMELYVEEINNEYFLLMYLQEILFSCFVKCFGFDLVLVILQVIFILIILTCFINDFLMMM